MTTNSLTMGPTIVLDVDHTKALLEFADRGMPYHSNRGDLLEDTLVSMLLFDEVKILPLENRHNAGMNRLYRDEYISDLPFSLFDEPLCNLDEYTDLLSNDVKNHDTDMYARVVANYLPFALTSTATSKLH